MPDYSVPHPFLVFLSHVQLNNELVRLRKEKMEQDSLVATLRDEVGALPYLPIFNTDL